MDLYGREAIVKVFAETAFCHSPQKVNVGGGHYAYVGFLYARRTYFDKFATFQHTQEACLGGEGEFGYLVEKYSAAVGLLEVALARVDGACERAFLMAEEL